MEREKKGRGRREGRQQMPGLFPPLQRWIEREVGAAVYLAATPSRCGSRITGDRDGSDRDSMHRSDG